MGIRPSVAIEGEWNKHFGIEAKVNPVHAVKYDTYALLGSWVLGTGLGRLTGMRDLFEDLKQRKPKK